MEQNIARGKKEEKEYYDEIKKNRIDQLKQQNEDEDKIIGKYEKLLKLNRRKRKSDSTSASKFNDGLDYLLELCTDDSIQKMYSAAKEVDQDESLIDYFEDLGQAQKASKKPKKNVEKDSKEVEEAQPSGVVQKRAEKLKKIEEKYFGDDEDFFNNLDVDSCAESDSELETGDEQANESESDSNEEQEADESDPQDEDESDPQDEDDAEDSEPEADDDPMPDTNSSNSNSEDSDNAEEEAQEEEEYEDIYGRKRDKRGNLIKEIKTKYVPPHLRNALNPSEGKVDAKHAEKLKNLSRLIKGQINRLAESNLHRIVIEIENLFSSYARHDVNTTLTEAITGSLVSNVISADRIVLEQTLLVATLHGNIGSEIGAFFLQNIVEKFDSMFQSIDELSVDDKTLDNVILIICHLYTYRLFKHTLVFEILDMLCRKMTEKRIECMLLVLKSVGFLLRKDDPLMLKEFIIKVQKLANTASDVNANNSRVMFMLDILKAIKNNNMNKIPQHDSSLVEHFRKLLKQFVRSGKYITTLAITMEDLLNADEKGKWWLVGSAWEGKDLKQKDNAGQSQSVGDEQQMKIYALAKQQRMNTDDKRNVFYILMTAEDYLDAFEKIVASVKDERSIIAVIIHCCLSEKAYNPYYSIVAQKFCSLNRKYMLTLQFTIWDKIKELNNIPIKQVSNLARFLCDLIENESLPLSVLKVIEFNQIEKATLRFLRQVMIGILLTDDIKFHQIFERITPNTKLKAFKDQLRLFMKVFLIKDEKKINIPDEHMERLKERMLMVDKFLRVEHF